MKKFDNEVAALEKRLCEMGDLSRAMVGLAAIAVKDPSEDVHERVQEQERRLDQMQTDIDEDAIRMLTVYGPVAKDLRYVLVCTHITSQLERIGDQVVNVIQALELLPDTREPSDLSDKLNRMADLACEMVDDALDAYFARNAEKATRTRRRDDLVDAMNAQVMQDMLTEDVLQQVLSGASTIGPAVAHILIACYLERIADQATNICKQVIYMERGSDVRHIRPEPNGDATS